MIQEESVNDKNCKSGRLRHFTTIGHRNIVQVLIREIDHGFDTINIISKLIREFHYVTFGEKIVPKVLQHGIPVSIIYLIPDGNEKCVGFVERGEFFEEKLCASNSLLKL